MYVGKIEGEFVPGTVYSCRHCQAQGRPAIDKLHLLYHLLQTATITHCLADVRDYQHHQHTVNTECNYSLC